MKGLIREIREYYFDLKKYHDPIPYYIESL